MGLPASVAGLHRLLAAGLFFFALSLAGQFDLGLSLTSVGGELAQKQGYAGSFFTGVLATIVATPCTAPLMGAAIGFALAQSAWITFAVFTALGSRTRNALPPLELPACVDAPSPASRRVDGDPQTAHRRPALWPPPSGSPGSTAVSTPAARQAGHRPSRPSAALFPHARHRRLGAGQMASAVGQRHRRRPDRRHRAGYSALSAQDTNLIWQPYSQQTLDQARAAGHPVFIDFTAAWCLSCQVNERLVLRSAEVQREFSKNNVTLLKADWTHYDPEITKELASVGRSGVPTYVIYPAGTDASPTSSPNSSPRTSFSRAAKDVT